MQKTSQSTSLKKRGVKDGATWLGRVSHSQVSVKLCCGVVSVGLGSIDALRNIEFSIVELSCVYALFG